jgi:hypothetical protein
MPARECARDNRPNKTSGDLDATAFNALIHGFADRTASIALTASVRAPHVRISIRANRYVFINPATPMLVEPVRLTINSASRDLRDAIQNTSNTSNASNIVLAYSSRS